MAGSHDLDMTGKRIYADHVAVRSDEAGDEFREPSGAGSDIENMLA